MTLDRNKLYSILLVACLAGYIWLYFSVTKNLTEDKSLEICLIKHTTGIPCPSCGSTRSIVSLIKGDFIRAFTLNPLGYVIASIMLISPIWIVTDFTMRNSTLFNCYQKAENYLKRPKNTVPLILLVIANWAWNILKGL